ncbi:MAG: MoaD/ThiS family protein [Candidatus Competibacterales bacterium]
MQITIKLYAMLSEFLPPHSQKNVGQLTLAEGTTVGAVIEQLRLPPRWVHLVLVNGVYIAPEQLGHTPLHEADVLAIWPPVAGG